MNISPLRLIDWSKGAVLLDKTYAVYFANRVVGKVQVIRQGLYYRISCRCRIGPDILCRLYVICNEKRENLGVVVPQDGGFALNTSIPVKKLGEGEWTFLLAPKLEPYGTELIPVYPEEPFAYIARLKKAYLVKQNGKIGIVIQ